MAEHLEISELHECRGLEVHVVGPYFLATFFYALGDVFAFAALVVSEAPNEVEEGFLEPARRSVTG